MLRLGADRFRFPWKATHAQNTDHRRCMSNTALIRRATTASAARPWTFLKVHGCVRVEYVVLNEEWTNQCRGHGRVLRRRPYGRSSHLLRTDRLCSLQTTLPSCTLQHGQLRNNTVFARDRQVRLSLEPMRCGHIGEPNSQARLQRVQGPQSEEREKARETQGRGLMAYGSLPENSTR